MRAPLPTYLTYAGTLPFVGSAALLLSGVKTLPLVGDIQRALMAYAVIIIAFMAGTHWGQHIRRTDRWATLLPLSSNIITICVWLAYLFVPPGVLGFLLPFFFFALLWIDAELLAKDVIPAAYFSLRVTATLIVVISCIGIGWASVW